jgi:hypothetical protein
VPDLVVPIAPTAAALAPASEKATRLARARWTDARLLLGVLLVMTSVVAGSRVVAGADRTGQVWSASTDLAAGTRLEPGDLQLRAVRLDSVARNYLAAGTVPVGQLLLRPLSAGDLVPVAAVGSASGAGDRRQVTVPVATFHYPGDLTRGRLVDVYITPASDAGTDDAAAAASRTGSGPPQLLLAGALVVDVEDGGTSFGGPSSTVGVVLSVPANDVAGLVGGLRRGPVDLVQVP